MREVSLPAGDLRRLGPIVGGARVDALLSSADGVCALLDGATVFCLNSTAEGGGVAEMLRALLPYERGVGINARWLVIDGDERFFAITKRLHNLLHGDAGDGGPLGDDERRHYERVMEDNAAQLASVVRRGDVVVLHDPQTAGLARTLRHRGARVVWRCHIGIDADNEQTRLGWAFLRPYLGDGGAEVCVFTRRAFAPPWLGDSMVRVIAPSIDPFSSKNIHLADDDVVAILSSAGLIGGTERHASYRLPDGTRRRIDHGADIERTGPPPPPDVPLVVQVSRWDRLKDMAGVLEGFARYIVADGAAHLVLAGPVVSAVADDPEGAEMLEECRVAWRRLPHHARRRITLACLPMADRDENAIIVNALQRHAAVVVQKSLAEGFGLTVSEAMYKRRAVVASAVGGIADQIVDGDSGVLLPDPTDLAAFGAALDALLADDARRRTIGSTARERVVDHFLPDTHLARWADLLTDLLAHP